MPPPPSPAPLLLEAPLLPPELLLLPAPELLPLELLLLLLLAAPELLPLELLPLPAPELLLLLLLPAPELLPPELLLLPAPELLLDDPASPPVEESLPHDAVQTRDEPPRTATAAAIRFLDMESHLPKKSTTKSTVASDVFLRVSCPAEQENGRSMPREGSQGHRDFGREGKIVGRPHIYSVDALG